MIEVIADGQPAHHRRTGTGQNGSANRCGRRVRSGRAAGSGWSPLASCAASLAPSKSRHPDLRDTKGVWRVLQR